MELRPTSLNQATLSQTVVGASTLVKVEVHMVGPCLESRLETSPCLGEEYQSILAT